MKILFLVYNRTDACSFYRSGGIIHDLEKRTNHEISILEWKDANLDWQSIPKYDIIMMQRPYTEQALNLCVYLKNFNVKIWVDHDDNLFEVNPENKMVQFYDNPTTQNIIKQIIQLADVVSVTNEYLRCYLNKLNDNIWIIPNAFNDHLLKRRKFEAREDVALWRGGHTHIYDIMCYQEPINSMAKKYEDWKFVFVGYSPWVLESTPNKSNSKETDIISYFNVINKLKPSVMHIPLHNNTFNRCKSNIAFIEGTYAGAVCVVPDWWNEPIGMSYSNQGDYRNALDAVMSGDINIERTNNLAWEYIMDCLPLSKVNNERIKLIKSL